MTTTQTRTAPARRVPPAARQPGPVTLAIRGLRPNEAPSWEMRQAQIAAEERQALRDLRNRIAAQIRSDLNRVDRCLNALNLMDGDTDIEPDAGEMGEGTAFGGNLDDEPSLCGLSVSLPSLGGDDREHDDAERGIADSGGLHEQIARYRDLVSA